MKGILLGRKTDSLIQTSIHKIEIYLFTISMYMLCLNVIQVFFFFREPIAKAASELHLLVCHHKN